MEWLRTKGFLPSGGRYVHPFNKQVAGLFEDIDGNTNEHHVKICDNPLEQTRRVWQVLMDRQQRRSNASQSLR